MIGLNTRIKWCIYRLEMSVIDLLNLKIKTNIVLYGKINLKLKSTYYPKLVHL